MREAALHAALDDMIAWLSRPEAQVAVFDATNSTEDRRNKLVCHQLTVISPIYSIRGLSLNSLCLVSHHAW